MLIISLLQSIFTSPGTIPEDWIHNLNEEIESLIQQEDQILQDMKRQHQQQFLQEIHIQSLYAPSQIQQYRKEDSSEVSVLEVSCTESYKESDMLEDIRIQLNYLVQVELLNRKGRRYCKKCQSFKPQRAHHCLICNACWLKMDHHCQWIDNCVGLENQKYYFNMLFYEALTMGILLINFSSYYAYQMNSRSTTDLKLYWITLLWLVLVLMFLVTLGMLVFNFCLMCNEITSLEYKEKSSEINLYSKGSVYRNLQASLGVNPLTWLIPFCGQKYSKETEL